MPFTFLRPLHEWLWSLLSWLRMHKNFISRRFICIKTALLYLSQHSGNTRTFYTLSVTNCSRYLIFALSLRNYVTKVLLRHEDIFSTSWRCRAKNITVLQRKDKNTGIKWKGQLTHFLSRNFSKTVKIKKEVDWFTLVPLYLPLP